MVSDFAPDLPPFSEEDKKQTELVTTWLENLKENKTEGFEQIWPLFHRRVTALGRKLLTPKLSRVFDEEDLASEVFQKFLGAVQGGQCDQIQSIEELWKYLATITANHAKNRMAAENSLKRGGGNIRGESIFSNGSPNGEDEIQRFDRFPNAEDFWQTHLSQDHSQYFIKSLPDPTLKKLTRMKVDGHQNEEIASELSISVRSVERKLALIRDLWKSQDTSC